MRLLNAMLGRFVRTGTLCVIDAAGKTHVHQGTAGPEVTIRITDPGLYGSLFLNPELRVGEAYMDGTLVMEKGTIRDLLLLFALNRENLRTQPLQRSLRRASKSLRAFQQRNAPSRARANVAHHYDLSNDLYRLFLDDDLHYSCAYFRKPDESLEEAQRNKLRHVAAKLALRPGQRVLDIGSGWGGLALYLAEAAEVEVVGVTLSTNQHSLATARAAERGLSDRVRFELTDYRDVTGQFDRIVSVAMFEAVGFPYFPAFFAKIASLLADDGVALLHSIGRMGGPGATAPWIRKYIFPGGYVPALSETLAAVEQAGLWTTDIEILRGHYAETFLAWDQRFQSKRDQAAALFDERFCRMWEFYLIATEVGFRYGKQMVFQMQLAKQQYGLPATRDYIAQAEADLARREGAGITPDSAPPDGS
jgi:cyclopropane-fatty-acyl-phospholipid synthase